MQREQLEGIILAVSIGVFLFYHVWLFWLRGKGYKVKDKYKDFFAAGKLARSLWAETCATDEKDAILGVQQARNAMTSCTYLATISVALATAGLTIIFDENKTNRIRQLSMQDPIMRHYSGQLLCPPEAVIAIALGSLYASFICFAQSVRLYVHTGFYIRACTSRFNPGTLTVREAKAVTIHAGFAFSIGLRLFYLFIPLIMWCLGPTYLLVSSFVMTAVVAYMDHFDMSDPGDANEQGDLEEQQHLSSGRPTAVQLNATSGAAFNSSTPFNGNTGPPLPALATFPQAAAAASVAAPLSSIGSLDSTAVSPLRPAGSAATSMQRQVSAAQHLEPDYVASMV